MQEGAGDALQTRALLPEPAGDGRQVVGEATVGAEARPHHEEGAGAPPTSTAAAAAAAAGADRARELEEEGFVLVM